MKQIQPVGIWVNGQLINANYFQLLCTNDNLTNTATFYFRLYANQLDQNGNILSSGELTMTDQDYIDYSSSPDSNTFAYNWGASKLNLTIIS